MRSAILAGAIIFLSGSSLFAQSVEEQLVELTAQRDKSLATATEQINRRYADQLKQLLRRAMQSKNLDASVKIKQELESLAAPATSPSSKEKYVGSLWRNTGGDAIELGNSGNYRETIGTQVVSGRWRLVSDTEVVVTRSDQTTWHFVITPDGTSITRKEKPITWSRVK